MQSASRDPAAMSSRARTSKSKHSVDLGFLSKEEVSAVLDVLERDKEVQRMNSERLREIKKTNQDKLWLKGVTGQWFEEIRKAKFKDQTDLAKILKMPHTCLRKQNRTALSDLKLPQSKSCPESKNGINHITFSGNSRGDDRLDPLSRPSDSSSQSIESHSDQNQCSNYNSLQLESSNVFSQLQVRLKTVTVPQAERKIHVYRDFGKEKHSKVRGQGLETKTIFVDEHEKILGTEDSSHSKLQKTITDEEGVKNYNHQLKQYRNDHETNILLNSSELSENAELQSVSTWCNIENVRNTPMLRNIRIQGNDCASVETAQYKIDNAVLPNSASSPQSSITEPKKIFQNQPINHTDDILTTNTDGCLSNSKRESTRTSLPDLLTKSQSALVVANSNINSQQSCSSTKICVPSKRDQDHSQSNSDSSSLSSIMGSRSLNVGNRDVQLNLSNSSLNISQKMNGTAYDGKSKSIPPISLPVPVHTRFSIYVHKWNTNSQNCDNTTFQRGGNDFLQTSKHKPISSLSLSEPVCQPRATSFIRVSSKTKHQYSGSDNTNITTQSAGNDDHLQSSRGGREITPLFPGIGKEKSSVDNLLLNKTRMEPVALRDAEGPLPESEGNSWKHSCKNEGRCTSLLPTELICSHPPTCVKTCMDSNVLQACPPNRTSAALQSGGNNFLEKIKHETSHELSADPKSAAKCVTNIIHHNSELLSNQSKTDDVSLVSVSNDSLQNGESETINATEMAITQPPNYKTFASQSLSSTNSALNLDINSKQNCREASGLTISTDCVLNYKFPIRSSYKYLLLDDLAKTIAITADATGNEHKSAPNCVPPSSDTLAEEASLSDIKNILKNASQNWPSQTVNSNLPKIHSVNDVQNDKCEKTSTPSSVVAMQWLSTNTNKGNSPKNYQNDENSNNAQKNISETVNEEQSSATITSQLKQNALLTYSSLDGGNEYLPKDKSDTDSKPSQDSLSGQVPLTNFIDSQDKSMTDFPLGDNTTMSPGTIKNAENYQSEKNIPISPHDTMSVQQFPTDTHGNMNKLLIHSSMRSGVIKNLENDQSENYKVDSLSDTATALMTPSGIIHGTKSTFQNWEQNSADSTMLRGIIKDGKEPDKSKMESARSVLDPVFNQLSLIHNKYCNEHDPQCHSLSSADVTGNRKNLGLLKNSESEIHSAVVSNKGAHQLSPINTTYNEVQQLIYLPNSAEIPRETEQEKAKATYPSSCLGPVINKPSPVTITHKYSDESLNCSFSHSTFSVDTEFNNLLQKDNPEISGVAPSADSLQSTAVEYLQESPTEITIIRKNGLEHYSRNVTDTYCDEASCDQYKSKRFGKTNNAFSSPPGITTLWLTSSIVCNNQNKPLIHMDRESNQFLQKNKSESHGTDPSPGILTVLQSTTTDIKKCAIHIDPSKVTEIVYDEKSCNKNVDDYQSENYGEILLGRVTGQRTGREKAQQNLLSNNDDTTLDRTLNKYNVQQNKSEIAHVSSAVDTVIGQQFSTNIPHRSKYQSLNYSPNCPAITLDRGNKHLQKDNTGSILPDSLSDQPSPINPHNKVKPLTHFPLHNDNNMAEKKAENHQSEESSLIPSPDALIDQKSLTNSHSNLDKPLTHSLESSDIEIDENVQKHKYKISPVTSPTYPFTSYRSAANVKKNTLQHQATKVTDIYHRKRPSGKFKLNVLLKAKSVPSPSAAESTQSIFENISQSSNQDKSKDLRLVRDDISLLVGRENIDKCQTYSAISPTDKLNGQWAPKNITQGWRNILPNCLPNVDGTTVDRDVNNTCDAVDKFETKCMLSPLNQVSSQMSPTDTGRSNEHRPLNHLLNSTAVNVHRESPDYLEKCKHKTKNALLSVDKVIQQKSPTSGTHGYKDKLLNHSTVQTDVDVIIQDYNQDKFKMSHVIPPIDLISSHQSAKNITHTDKHETLNCSLNCATVTAGTGVNEYLRKDPPETNPIPAVDLLNDTQSTTTITDIKKNTRHNYSSHLAETCLDKIPYKTFNFKDLHKSNSAPSSPPKVTGQWPITNTIHNNQDKSSTRSTLSGEFRMNRSNNSCLQKCKSETNDEFSLSTSLAGQQSPLNIRKSKPDKSLAHSPNKSDFVRDTGIIKNLENCQPKNNRATFLWPDADIACDNTKFQNWFPTRDLSLNQQCDVNMKHYQSETGNTVSSQDLLIDQESFIGVTCSKKIKYLRESTKSGYITLARRYYGSCEQIDKDLINNISSPHDLSPTLLSPSDIVHGNKNVTCDHSPICADLPAQDGNNAKGNGKIFRRGRKSFCGEMFQNRTLGMKNANVSNFLQLSSRKKNQIDSDITEINNFRNRLNAYSDVSQYRASIDEDDSANNNLQAGTARFSKRYCRFTRSPRPSLQNIPHGCGNMYKAKSLKDINSDYNQSPLQDHEHFFATNSLQNSKLTVRNGQFRPSLQFSNNIKSSRLCRSYSDLPSSDGNESDYNNWISYQDSKFSELLSGNVSKEDKKKETYLENMRRVLVTDRLWKPGYLHKESSSPKSEDVFDPCTSEVNQDPGVNDDSGQNDEYFPVDIKIFWPKENPSDIMRLLSSSSTGSKISENSLSPPQHHTPAVIDKPNFSCYSDTNSDTTTDDEYFLDGNETAKESAL